MGRILVQRLMGNEETKLIMNTERPEEQSTE
jgi:hypothetical protein